LLFALSLLVFKKIAGEIGAALKTDQLEDLGSLGMMMIGTTITAI